MNVGHAAMERLLIATLLCASMFAGSLPAYTPQEQEHALKEMNRRSLSGWPFILFFCNVPPPDSNAQESAKRICEASASEARLIAAQSNLSLRTVDSLERAYAISYIDGALVLEMDVVQTQDAQVPSGASVSLEAWSYATSVSFKEYDRADRFTVVREQVRSGRLNLWLRRTVIGGSTEDPRSLVTEMSASSEQMLKQFFADYLEAQQPASP
jgi:hypothetical protein